MEIYMIKNNTKAAVIYEKGAPNVFKWEDIEAQLNTINSQFNILNSYL